MPEDMTEIALKVTPHILKALGASEELAGPICETIQKVGCKDEIAFTQALNALGPAVANISAQYMKTLNNVTQVYMQSSSKNYELIVEAVVHDPDASIEEKVEYVSRLEKEHTDNTNTLLKTIIGGGVTFAGIVATAIAGPKLSGDARAMYSEHQKTERVKAVVDGIVSMIRGRRNGG